MSARQDRGRPGHDRRGNRLSDAGALHRERCGRRRRTRSGRRGRRRRRGWDGRGPQGWCCCRGIRRTGSRDCDCGRESGRSGAGRRFATAGGDRRSCADRKRPTDDRTDPRAFLRGAVHEGRAVFERRALERARHARRACGKRGQRRTSAGDRSSDANERRTRRILKLEDDDCRGDRLRELIGKDDARNERRLVGLDATRCDSDRRAPRDDAAAELDRGPRWERGRRDCGDHERAERASEFRCHIPIFSSSRCD